ncbi:MAG: DUF89 family protein [Candidatus Marinimicrobia bacterium]|nr:DUF89 family protein [Candidatus Neomarinimicrobiota bacterium]
MKTYLDCLPCMLQQALRAGRIATTDEKKIKTLLNTIGMMIQDIPMDNSPPEMGNIIYRKIREITGVYDPYKKIKADNINEVLALYPELIHIMNKSKNRLLTAIRLAIAGNVIDFGVNKEFNIPQSVQQIITQDFAILDLELFHDQLEKARSVLYLGDNAGESVFDKILITELGKPVTYVVRAIPVINDVTKEDAINSGLDEVAEVISSGTTAPATILSLCNDDFLKRFNDADMIISKGQGNYESLSGVERSLFFLLKAKCPLIARDLNVAENDIVLKAINLHETGFGTH